MCSEMKVYNIAQMHKSSINQKQLLFQPRHSNSIFTAEYMGPQFGLSPELKLSDACDKYNNSLSVLGKSTRTFKEPEGSTSFVKGHGGFFLCEDYEVYSVSIYNS